MIQEAVLMSNETTMPQEQHSHSGQAGRQDHEDSPSQRREPAGQPGAKEAALAATTLLPPQCTCPSREESPAGRTCWICDSSRSLSSAMLHAILWGSPEKLAEMSGGSSYLAYLLDLRSLWQRAGFPDPELPPHIPLIEGLGEFLEAGSCMPPKHEG